MPGRGIDKDPRGRRKWGGKDRGRGSPPPAHEARRSEPKLKGSNPDLPTRNYGAAPKQNQSIEFLQLFGEHCAINYKSCIAQAFETSPSAFGEEDEEPVLPDQIPNTNAIKAILADYTNDSKEWKLETKKIEEHKKAVFALLSAQLSESSRSEVKDHEDWTEGYAARDLSYLIRRIRATHIARQSGNPAQDMERVRNN
jgi:hypothetical protein